MKKYTIGILFKKEQYGIFHNTYVALIHKLHPEWQTGIYNFPGGKVEEDEEDQDCIVREFFEETGLTIKSYEWKNIGCLKNDNCIVEIFTAIYNSTKHGKLITKTDEEVNWYECDELPNPTIENLDYLIPYAFTYHYQTDPFKPKYATFELES